MNYNFNRCQVGAKPKGLLDRTTPLDIKGEYISSVYPMSFNLKKSLKTCCNIHSITKILMHVSLV